MSVFHKLGFWLFVFIFLFLMFLGGQAAAQPFVFYSRLFSFLYFFYFLVILPSVPRFEEWAVRKRFSAPGAVVALLFIFSRRPKRRRQPRYDNLKRIARRRNVTIGDKISREFRYAKFRAKNYLAAI